MSFELGIITDEVSQDFERALDLVLDWELRTVEVRTLWEKNVVDLTPAEIDRARTALESRGLTVSCIASPLFKASLREGDEAPDSAGFFTVHTGLASHPEVLSRAIMAARVLGARTIRTFSFWRQIDRTQLLSGIASHLREAAAVAAEEGFTLALENEFSCNAATGQETADLLAAIGRTDVGAIWDPANALVAGETPFPHGYVRLRGRVRHVHVKDCVRSVGPGQGPWRLLGQGDVDWRGQLAALRGDRYAGPLTLEPHPIEGCSPEEAAYRCLEALRTMLRAYG